MSAATKPDITCALEELTELSILPYGWVLVNRNVDGMGGVGIKYLGGLDPLARIEALETKVAEWEAATRYTLAHYPEDAFPATGTSQDAKTGTFARGLLSRLLDPIERKQYAALAASGPPG